MFHCGYGDVPYDENYTGEPGEFNENVWAIEHAAARELRRHGYLRHRVEPVVDSADFEWRLEAGRSARCDAIYARVGERGSATATAGVGGDAAA